jgi:PPOX class probable F420-dependent enzyme
VANQRAEIAMTAAEAHDFLRAGRICVLVTLGPDGLPDPVPMWYVVDDEGRVVMRTFAKSQKVVNLRRDPRYSALIEAGERYVELRGVQLTGTVELVDDPGLVADTLTGLALKYEGLEPQHADGFRAAALARVGKQVALRLRVDRLVSWDHRKLAVDEAAGAGA